MKDRELEKAMKESKRVSRCKIHGEHLSRNIYESAAGNETDEGRRRKKKDARAELPG